MVNKNHSLKKWLALALTGTEGEDMEGDEEVCDGNDKEEEEEEKEEEDEEEREERRRRTPTKMTMTTRGCWTPTRTRSRCSLTKRNFLSPTAFSSAAEEVEEDGEED